VNSVYENSIHFIREFVPLSFNLKEYIAIEKLPLQITGFEIQNEMHAIAYMVVNDDYMIAVRDALKPHRGEVYQE
jgi:hypothetical protein